MDQTLYTTLLLIPAALFTMAFLATTWTILRPGNSLDRLFGMDGLTAIIQCVLATYICWSLDTTVSNAMLVIALLGFIGTIAVARFRRKDGS